MLQEAIGGRELCRVAIQLAGAQDLSQAWMATNQLRALASPPSPSPSTCRTCSLTQMPACSRTLVSHSKRHVVAPTLPPRRPRPPLPPTPHHLLQRSPTFRDRPHPREPPPLRSLPPPMARSSPSGPPRPQVSPLSARPLEPLNALEPPPELRPCQTRATPRHHSPPTPTGSCTCLSATVTTGAPGVPAGASARRPASSVTLPPRTPDARSMKTCA